MTGCFHYDNERSSSRRCREYHDHLRDCQVLRKSCALMELAEKVSYGS